MRIEQGGGNACAFLICALLAATGCSASTPDAFRLEMDIAVAPRANRSSPVPLSLVAIRDQKLLERVAGMTARQWFAERAQIRKDFPGSGAFTEWEWEYVPGQRPPPLLVDVGAGAIGTMFFANYRSLRDHRVRLGSQRRIRIDLGDDEIVVRAADTPSAGPWVDDEAPGRAPRGAPSAPDP